MSYAAKSPQPLTVCTHPAGSVHVPCPTTVLGVKGGGGEGTGGGTVIAGAESSSWFNKT